MKLRKYVEKSKFVELLDLHKNEFAFCIAYFIFALIISAYSTPYGALFKLDSIAYVADGENFLSRFPTYASGPMFPALIAIGIAFGLTSELSAGLVPIICYALLGFPIYFIGKIIGRPISGYISCIICLLCGRYILILSSTVATVVI